MIQIFFLNNSYFFIFNTDYYYGNIKASLKKIS
jgi:hypothetical protein